MDTSYRWIRRLERAQALLLSALLIVSILAFGGQVWWFPLVCSVLVSLLAFVSLGRAFVRGSFSILKSPIAALAVGAIVLGLFQITPLPATLVSRQSARSVTSWTQAYPVDSSPGDPVDAALLSPLVQGKMVLTADRSATLRWVLVAIGCLTVFVVAGHFSDSLKRTRLIWGSLVVAFSLCTWAGTLQLVGQASGAFGLISPGVGPSWAPSQADLTTGPVLTSLRPLGKDRKKTEIGAEVVVARVDPGFAIGPLVAGPSAYLALASLALPLVFGMALFRLSPRGSRESLAVRLSPHGGFMALSFLLTTGFLAVGLTGFLGGLLLGGVLLAGISVVCLASLRGAGVARSAILILLTCIGSLYAGDALGNAVGRPQGSPWLASAAGRERTQRVWSETVQIGLRFPLFGVGLNSFGPVHNMVKRDDVSSSTALSSLGQWWAETGLAGLLILTLGLTWFLWRLPAAWNRVGSADRALPASLLGACFSFGLFSAVAWTIQLPAIAIAAAALGGTMNRWLAGGTDLFVETGRFQN